MPKKTTSSLIKLITGKIAIVDGGDFGSSDSEGIFSKFLTKHKIKHDVLTELYSASKDLSKYDTLAFWTTGVDKEGIDKIIDFDIRNVKTVIAMNANAFSIIYYAARKHRAKSKLFTKIKVIGFDSGYAENFLESGFDYEKILFIPQHRWSFRY